MDLGLRARFVVFSPLLSDPQLRANVAEREATIADLRERLERYSLLAKNAVKSCEMFASLLPREYLSPQAITLFNILKSDLAKLAWSRREPPTNHHRASPANPGCP